MRSRTPRGSTGTSQFRSPSNGPPSFEPFPRFVEAAHLHVPVRPDRHQDGFPSRLLDEAPKDGTDPVVSFDDPVLDRRLEHEGVDLRAPVVRALVPYLDRHVRLEVEGVEGDHSEAGLGASREVHGPDLVAVDLVVVTVDDRDSRDLRDPA